MDCFGSLVTCLGYSAQHEHNTLIYTSRKWTICKWRPYCFSLKEFILLLLRLQGQALQKIHHFQKVIPIHGQIHEVFEKMFDNFQYELITVKANITTFTWKSHESAGSWVEVETRGQSSAGPPAGSSSGCQTAPVTLKTTEERWMMDDEMQHLSWGKHSCKHYKAITLLTIAIQQRDEGLHHHAKRVTVPRVSIFLRKHFKAFNLSTTCSIRTCEQKRSWVFFLTFFHHELWCAYLLLWRNAAGFSHTLNVREKLRSWRKLKMKTQKI